MLAAQFTKKNTKRRTKAGVICGSAYAGQRGDDKDHQRDGGAAITEKNGGAQQSTQQQQHNQQHQQQLQKQHKNSEGEGNKPKESLIRQSSKTRSEHVTPATTPSEQKGFAFNFDTRGNNNDNDDDGRGANTAAISPVSNDGFSFGFEINDDNDNGKGKNKIVAKHPDKVTTSASAETTSKNKKRRERRKRNKKKVQNSKQQNKITNDKMNESDNGVNSLECEEMKDKFTLNLIGENDSDSDVDEVDFTAMLSFVESAEALHVPEDKKCDSGNIQQYQPSDSSCKERRSVDSFAIKNPSKSVSEDCKVSLLQKKKSTDPHVKTNGIESIKTTKQSRARQQLSGKSKDKNKKQKQKQTNEQNKITPKTKSKQQVCDDNTSSPASIKSNAFAFNQTMKGKAIVNRGSMAVRRERIRQQKLTTTTPGSDTALNLSTGGTSTENTSNNSSGSNAFSFGFNFGSLLPPAASNDEK